VSYYELIPALLLRREGNEHGNEYENISKRTNANISKAILE
jgi:hypothetical protein